MSKIISGAFYIDDQIEADDARIDAFWEKLTDTPTRFSEYEERTDSFVEEIRSYAERHGVNLHDMSHCGSCRAEYPVGLAPLTGERCVPCYGESRGIILMDAPVVDEMKLRLETKTHYVFDNNDPSWDNAVRFDEDGRHEDGQ